MPVEDLTEQLRMFEIFRTLKVSKMSGTHEKSVSSQKNACDSNTFCRRIVLPPIEIKKHPPY